MNKTIICNNEFDKKLFRNRIENFMEVGANIKLLETEACVIDTVRISKGELYDKICEYAYNNGRHLQCLSEDDQYTYMTCFIYDTENFKSIFENEKILKPLLQTTKGNIFEFELSFPKRDKKPFYHGMTTIIIGTHVVDYRTLEVDTPPFPEHDSGHYLEIGGEGFVFSCEKYDDDNRCQSGVIESHYGTSDWESILSTYKKWLADKGKSFSYLFVLLSGELVHHEINPSNLI